MSNRCEHGVAPAEDCDECVDDAIATMVGPDVYAQGRAAERAAVVAWLRASGRDREIMLADDIERGEHEVKKP